MDVNDVAVGGQVTGLGLRARMVAQGLFTGRRGGRHSLLIADHEEGQRRALSVLLRTEGHETHLAADDEEAVEIVHRERIDVVILELELPRSGGIDLFRSIKSLARGPVACVFTAEEPSPRAQMDALIEDAFTVVPKPIDDVVMKQVIESVIRRYFPWPNEG